MWKKKKKKNSVSWVLALVPSLHSNFLFFGSFLKTDTCDWIIESLEHWSREMKHWPMKSSVRIPLSYQMSTREHSESKTLHQSKGNDADIEPRSVQKQLITPLSIISSLVCGLGGSAGCAVRLETRRSRVQPRRGRQHSFVKIDHEIFSTVILSLLLIHEGSFQFLAKECAQYWLTA